MLGYLFKVYGIDFALNVISVIITALLLTLFSFCETVISGYVTGIIVSLIIYTVLILLCKSSVFAFTDEYANEYWSGRRKAEKPFKGYKMQILVLPILLIVVGVIICMAVFYGDFTAAINSIIEAAGDKAGDSDVLERVREVGLLTALIATCVGGRTVYYGYLVIHYLSNTCKGCGNIFCHERKEILSHKNYDEVKTKTKDTYGKVGELYCKDKKIMDISGKTGTQTYETHWKGHHSEYLCECVYCNNQKTIDEYDAYKV